MDNATVEQAMEGSNYLTTYDIKSYETMTAISERFNKAVDKLVESVSKCGLHEYFKHRVGQSGVGTLFVDIKFIVPSQDHLLIIKYNSKNDVNIS